MLAEIGPENIRGYYRNLVDVNVDLPVDEIQQARANAEIYDRGAISKLTLAERSGVENPLLEQARRAAEDMIEHPAMKEARAVQAAIKWGVDITPFLGAQEGQSPTQIALNPQEKKKRRPAVPTPTPPAEGTADEADLVDRQSKQDQGSPKRNAMRRKKNWTGKKKTKN